MELKLILLLTDLLAVALTCERFFDAFLFTGLQIKRVTLDFLDNVFRLHLALETTQGVLKGFAFLYSNLCQEKYTSKQSQSGIGSRIRHFDRKLHKIVGNLALESDEIHCMTTGVAGQRKIYLMIRSYQGVTPVIPTSCYTDPSAQIIGDVILGEQASVWMNAVVRGDVNSIRIGAKSNVQDCAVLHGMRYLYPVIVGEMVTIGHNATVHGCVLEDTVLVGIGATILNNARIGEGSIIAAGAVIPEQTVIPPNSLVAGVPGKVRRTLGDADRALILKYAQNYLDYTAIYLRETAGS